MTRHPTLSGVSAVSIEGRAILVEGPPGSGKSSLALALIDRGADLIGDDGVSVEPDRSHLTLGPPPNIAGKMEIRGVGIVELQPVSAPLALILSLQTEAPRFPDKLGTRDIAGHAIPVLPFMTGDANQALRAEWALRTHGLTF